jgi:Ca2+-binding EF-hand superfamily protein
MDILRTEPVARFLMRSLLVFALTAVPVFAQAGADRPGRPPVMKRSPVLNILDVNQDVSISAAELAAAPSMLPKLDQDGDGQLSLAEAGIQRVPDPSRPVPEPPSPPPTVEALTSDLLMFDANHDNKLEKKEVPARMQGIFERGDLDHDQVLSHDELVAMSKANQQTKLPVRRPGGVAFNAVDTRQDGTISSAEIANAAASLKTLDKNGDGRIEESELAPVRAPRH